MNPPPPPGYGGHQAARAGTAAISMPNPLASQWLRVVGGVIDFVLLLVVFGVLESLTNRSHGLSTLVELLLALVYFGYFWSSRGQSIGMMVFGFRVRNRVTGRFPSVGMAVLRGFVWWLEVALTVCLVGLVAWLWMFWDPQRQGFHDKVAGTVVTAG